MKHLFIGGSPKSGTGTLFEYLANHPQIDSSNPKETFYFLDKGHPLLPNKYNYFIGKGEGFKTFFLESNKVDPSYRMEATTHLLYQKNALNKINSLGDSYWIFILREPASRIYSSFQYTLNNLGRFKKELSFSNYVEILISKKTYKLKKYINEGPSLYVLQRELEYSQYANYLATWQIDLPKDRLKILPFEALQNIEQTTQEVYKWLQLENSINNNQRIIHRNKTFAVYNLGLHKTVKSIPFVKHLPFKKQFRDIYIKYAGKAIIKSTEDRKAIQRLETYFKPFNQKLRLLNAIDWEIWT